MASFLIVALAQEPSSPNLSQRPQRRTERREALVPSLRADVNRVLVPVTVIDAQGRKVQGLHKEDFRIFQDGIPQTLTEFFVDEHPVSVGIVLDASNSMRDKIDPSRRALSTFLRMSSREDEFFLIGVQDKPSMLHGFTKQVDEIEQEMQAVKTQGWTALYDGMYLGMNRMKRANASDRVMLVLSDGEDNNSRYTESEMKNVVRESEVRIFSISVMGRAPSLERLAQESGGLAYHVHNLEELSDLAVSLSAIIHGEYVVGFSPSTEARDGKFHAIKLEMEQPKNGSHVSASWRHGYYAPVE
jgi:Ca-activated chloride channel family protein